MDIYTLLSSKPHNKFQLDRYLRFIKSCENKNRSQKNEKLVKHHICPRKLFPEYINLKENEWNCSKLTNRQHFISHIMLWKVFPYKVSMAAAAWGMLHKNGEKLNSKIYETLMIENSVNTSRRNSKKMWVNNLEKSTIICPTELEKYISEGWIRGRIFSEDHKKKISDNAKERYKDPSNNPRFNAKVSAETRLKIAQGNTGKKLSDKTKLKISTSNKGRKITESAKEKIGAFHKNTIWITDGSANMKVYPGCVIPDGWYRGLTKKLAK
jgi:hypothetical protein